MVVYNIEYTYYKHNKKEFEYNRIPQSIENIKCVSEIYKVCKEYKSNLQHGRKYIYIRDMNLNNGE